MRVAFLDGDLGGSGGAQRSNLYAAQYLSARGHSLALLHGKGGSLSLEWDRVVHGRLELGSVQLPRRQPVLSVRRVRAALKFVRRFDPDVIYCYSFDQLPIASLAARWCGVPLLYHIRTPLPRDSRRNRRRMRRPSHFVSVSRSAMVEHRRLLPDIESRCVVVPNGVDLTRFKPLDVDAKKSVRRSIGADSAKPLIGYFGRLSPEKGVLELLHLHRRMPATSQLTLVVVGGAANKEEQRYERELHQCAADGVIFLGHQEDAATLMAAVDVIVMPSQVESFGRVAVEGLACGVAVVASAVGGLTEVFEPDLAQYLFPVGDEGAMERALSMALETLADGRNNATFRRTAERFDLRLVQPRLERVILALTDAAVVES